MKLSVIVPCHNPHPGRLARTLDGLAGQTIARTSWELLLVDNASHPCLTAKVFGNRDLPRTRLIEAPLLGLSHARREGFLHSDGEILVLVDDDNELAPDYLSESLRCFEKDPQLGALGGKSLPEFEHLPPPEFQEFLALLALRDLGEVSLVSEVGLVYEGGRAQWPTMAPLGAGMALKREAVQTWLKRESAGLLSDRKGGALSSGGDNDIVFHVLEAGWRVAYEPKLCLTHLIPSSRLEPKYLARLNHGIQKSWMQVLSLHRANPWPPLSPWGAKLRKFKAWFTYKAWEGPREKIRYAGACGHFEGRISD